MAEFEHTFLVYSEQHWHNDMNKHIDGQKNYVRTSDKAFEIEFCDFWEK